MKNRRKKQSSFKFKPFSEKQLKVMKWWRPNSPYRDYDGIICDGAVRAGKTASMSLSYIIWALETFDNKDFGMAGKTIGSHRRNVIKPLKRMLRSRGYRVKDHRSDNMLTISFKGKTNDFYLFGGKDESSQDLIQGITLAGMFFDEVALMPKSFVEQAIARLSIDGAKQWFNCNPDSPYHWFKLEFIDGAEEKQMLVLHFTMDDNLSLSERVKERYKRSFTGIFYQRYILGLWVMAEGVIYDMFNKDKHVVKTEDRPYTRYYISCDYGTQNPFALGLWGLYDGVWYKVREYHYGGREKGIQRTDEQYFTALDDFANRLTKKVIIDPSATSFITLVRQKGWKVIKAKNDVLEGIRNVASCLGEESIKYNDCCVKTFKEFSSYIWDEKATLKGLDAPLKTNDHHMDSDRYFVNTIVKNKNKLGSISKDQLGVR
ncbi:PBSX family phage terminase large subunit [Listeria seeligeri]|uniref:PBSX family phage terminase large subunit n=1 Tax=Listeria seeligeri TaxID=1640 RepID=UPI0001C4EC7B|nr:PBSX family phage terminase large subunit [Listeria seeligeri]CBH27763.1 phage terminase large subunit [Listeria seeligeri serovar 1/2b str. SLCC3954]